MPTNFKKLVGWYLPEYNKLSDEGCLVCLTEKEKYLLGQMTRQLTWLTRWDNPQDDVLPDLYELQGRLDYKMSENSCIDICELIIECINDPESGVSDAILNLVGNSTLAQSRDAAQAENGKNLTGSSNPTCDLDILFGQSLQMVEYFDQVNRDVLEIIEVVTNQAELIADIIGNLTGPDELSIDVILDWVAYVQDSILENYDAQVTQTYLEDVACEIFCIARDQNCAITPTLLYDVFRARLSASVTIESLIEDTLNYLVSGLWSGTEIADFMYFAQFAFRAQVGRFVGKIAWSDVELRLAVYANDPNSDWSLLCDCPTEWESIIDFTESQHGFSFLIGSDSDPIGEWQDGVGMVAIVGEYNNQDCKWVFATLEFDEANVTYVNIEGTYTRGYDGGQTQLTATSGQVRNNGNNVMDARLNYGDYTIGVPTVVDTTETGDVTADGVLLSFRADYNGGTSGGGTVTTMTLRGTGTKPAQLP